MKEFKPTFLYIKRHKITGLLYFGKTTGTEKYLLERYNGSGTYWKDHLKIHGKEHVETPWYCLFTEKDELVKFALQCSELWNIVNAKDENGKKIWANEKPEDGLEGGNGGANRGKTGRKQPPEEKAKQIAAQTGKKRNPHTTSTKNKISVKNKGNIAWNKGLTKDDPRVAAQAKAIAGKASALKGRSREKATCPHCAKVGGGPQMKQWHFDNCKKRTK